MASGDDRDVSDILDAEGKEFEKARRICTHCCR